MFNSSYQQIDIMLTKDGIHTLLDIVIVDPMQVDLFPQPYTIQRFVASDATQTKEKNYCD
jgi:hypothetical protein